MQKDMSLLFNTVSRIVIVFLSRTKCLLVSYPQSPSAVILEPRKIKSLAIYIVSPFIFYELMKLDALIFIP